MSRRVAKAPARHISAAEAAELVRPGMWVDFAAVNSQSEVFDRALAEQLHDVFADDLSGCEQVTLERWRRRGAWARVQEVAAAFLQEQA